MKLIFGLVVSLVLLILPTLAGQPASNALTTGLKNPHSVAVGSDDKLYVTVMGEVGKDGDGAIMLVENGKATPFTAGLDDPRGLAVNLVVVGFGKAGPSKGFFVADKERVLQIDPNGKSEVFAAAKAFPNAPTSLTGIAVDRQSGTVYVSDAGDKAGKGGAIYKITTKKAVSEVTTALQQPTGLVMDGQNHLLVLESGTGKLSRIHLANGKIEVVAEGLGGATGLAWDIFGRIFITDTKGGKVFAIPRAGASPVPMAQGFKSPANIGTDAAGSIVYVPDMIAGTVTAVPIRVPGAEVDESPMPLEAVVAFPKLQWTDWKSVSDTGKQNQLRPILLTHAGDGSNRVFVATQHGVVHVFPNNPQVDKTAVFLDIEKRVVYNDKTNEEGFLGLAFHPQYKKNGEFFIFYTLKQQDKNKHTNVISRMRVSKDDPNRADPAFEEELLRIERTTWNHNGGTLCFGPDGYLYFCTGDGGGFNDPNNFGQNLQSWNGKVFRIDIDKKDAGKNYAIPKDNPFVGRKDALPEVWAYGLRNIWRMSFDRKTGKLWAGEVGQDLYEEIDIIVKGGNYGWKVREGFHPFSDKGVGPRQDLIEPIWEYHHSLGLCIIGGHVYRGKQLPELDGAYLYADYASGKVWALRYDEAGKRVTANRPVRTPGIAIQSFGEDEQGEVYFMTTTQTGQGLYHFRRQSGAP